MNHLKKIVAAAGTLFILSCAAGGSDDDNNNNSNTPGNTECSGDLCVLTGSIMENKTLTADKKWLLRGGVFVGNDSADVTLTIQPGTRIFGESSTNGMLVITRGAKIMAEGTKEKPIVFSSSKADGSRARGDWGGVIINGRAPVNGCTSGTATCEAFGEGGTGYYGGNNPEDNSGVLRYVRVEFAGRLISPDNELNGIAFQGVGRGTTVDFIQVHMAADDCIEFFGGTVGVKHVLCTGGADDNLDWTDGWVGKLQFLVALQYEDAGDNGIEADNNAEDNASSPRSHPMLPNITLVGSPDSDLSDVGVLLREGTGANISNMIVTGFNEGCLDIDHSETFNNAIQNGQLTGHLTIENSILNCAHPFVEDAGEPTTAENFFKTLNVGNSVEDPVLVDLTNLAAPNLAPGSTSPALSNVKSLTDSFFTPVTYRGGVDPNDNWLTGWTNFSRN